MARVFLVHESVQDVSDWSKSKVKRILEMTKEAATRLNKACDAYKACARR